MSIKTTLACCKKGIDAWKNAFNSQDAAGCAKQYKENATMEAKPFGTFEGRDAIQKFWRDIMDQGFCDVKYTNVKWEKLSEHEYLLSSNWTMNKAFGVVHREHWVVEEDGIARLLSDEFEVLGER